MNKKKKKIFIIAGEKSGDLLGSKIIKGFDKKKYEFYGVGGEFMEKAGLKSLFSIDQLSIMGIFELLPKLFTIIKLIRKTVDYVFKIKPDIVLTIDAPDFSFRVMKLIKKRDKKNKIKKIHLVAPSVWAYRKSRAKKIAKIYDLLFCILPFEKQFFTKYNLKTVFVGHPIFYKESTEYEFNKKENIYNSDSSIISITVGSRLGEVKKFLPIIKKVIFRLDKTFKSKYKYYFLATENTKKYLEDNINNSKNIKIITDNRKKINTIKNSVIGLTKSGTNTLEFSAFSIPIVVFYKFGFFTNLIAKFFQKINNFRFANLLNIISKKEIIAEFILDKCNSDDIYNSAVKLLKNKKTREKQIQQIAKPLTQMGLQQGFSIKTIVNEIIKIL